MRSVDSLRLKGKVEVIANASQIELKNILQKAKIYLHTTVGEHFGISIVEAMASGCIPIVHDSGEMREFVPAKYRYADLHDAAKKIENALHKWTPQTAKSMVDTAEKYSERNFSKIFSESFRSYLE